MVRPRRMEPSPSAVGLVSVTRQRLVGLLVLVVVAVASLVVAQLLHPPITGNASRGSIPDPPAVGDCLLDPTLIGQLQFQGTTLIHPWLRTGPCQGRRFGEVTAVLTPPDLPPAPVSTGPSADANKSPMDDAYLVPCSHTTRAWLGFPDPLVAGQWTPDLLPLALVMSGPSQVQHASGQDWVACIAAVGGGQGRSSTTAGYDATAHHSINPGPALPAFADCTAAVNSSIPVSCTTTHTAEQLGVMVSPGSVTEQDRRGCRALARRLTAMPDITAGGRLTPTTVDTSSANGAGVGQHSAECWMVAVSPHQLTGPLLGLSNRPAPIT